ncbi:MAG: tetratricopeptide repeat protein [Chitinophagaceae bacterium]
MGRSKKFYILGWLLIYLGWGCAVQAQSNLSPESAELFSTAQKFLNSGDYSNAIIVLNQAIQADPENLSYRQELALTYYLRQDFGRAFQIIRPLVNNQEANSETFQIAGNIDQARQDFNGAEKIYTLGLKKFPGSGALYDAQGQLFFREEKYEKGLKVWLKGIQADPNFSGNYYHAAKTYYEGKNNFWPLIYGEIFINLEPFSTRTFEIKGLLLNAYKNLFDHPDAWMGGLPSMSGQVEIRGRSMPSDLDFRMAFLQTLAGEAVVITQGITPATLIMLRTRFLLNWYSKFGNEFPFNLFDYQREMLRQGLFEEYNQWLFGPVANLGAYKTWLTNHNGDHQKFLQWFGEHPLTLKEDQFYNMGKSNLDWKAITHLYHPQ